MFTTMLKVNVASGKQKEALEILQSVGKALTLKHDFVSSTAYKLYGEDNTILYIEQWKTKEALYRHIQSDLYRRILTVMELAKEPPDISFSEFEEGLELIQALREAK